MSGHQPPWAPVFEEEIVQTPAKFNIGDRVCWHQVPSRDFGAVRDRFYGVEGSVQARGWHYLVALAPQSPSFSYCKEDYGFEDDLEFVDQGRIE
jgi:hypothetical protein